MLKKIAPFAALMALFSGSAYAQTCGGFPNNLTNGTTADASQVMANFNAVLSCVGGLRGYLGGLTMSNDATTPNTVVDTATGVTDSDDGSTLMSLSAVTKNANSSWSAGTGSGCLDTGSSLAVNTWYNLFVIERTDTNVVDEICSTSVSSPIIPNGYTKKRRIGSFLTDSSAHILPFVQHGNEFWWKNRISSVSGATLSNGPRVPYTVSTPIGIQTKAIFNAQTNTLTQTPATNLVFSSSDQNDNSASAADIIAFNQSTTTYIAERLEVWTNTSAQIYAKLQGASSTTLYIDTLGWIDYRGQYN